MAAIVLGVSFLILSFISLRISISLSTGARGKVVFSPILLFTILQIIMVNLGLVISVVKADVYYGKLYLIMISTLTLNLGALTLGKPTFAPVLKNYRMSDFNRNIIIIGYLATVFILIILSEATVTGFMRFINEVVTGNISEGINGLAETRKTYSFSGVSNGISEQMKNIVLVFLTILIVSLNYKKTLKVIIVATTIFFLLTTGQKWPIFEALMVYCVFLTFSRSIKIRFKMVFWVGLSIYLSLFVLSYFSGRFSMTDNVFENILLNFEGINFRLFVSQNITTFYIFDLIPDSLDFGLGSYIIRDFSTLSPGYQESFSTFIFRITHGGKAGSASFSTLTLFFADFGRFSIFVAFLYGMAIQSYSIWVFSRVKSIARIIFHSFVVVAIATTSLGSVSGIVTHGLLSGFLMYNLLRFVLERRRSSAVGG